MYNKLPPAFSEVVENRGKSPQKVQKIMNKKGAQRRYTHKMTLGDSESEVFTARFDPTDRYLACGFGDGAIRIYNTQTAKCAFTLCSFVDQQGQSDDMPVTALRWRPTTSSLKTANVLVSAQADGYIKHWHATSGKCLHQRTCEDNPDQ